MVPTTLENWQALDWILLYIQKGSLIGHGEYGSSYN